MKRHLLPGTLDCWMCPGVIAAAVLRAWRPAHLQVLGRVFTPAEEQPVGAHQ
jgi:hypothetical protein